MTQGSQDKLREALLAAIRDAGDVGSALITTMSKLAVDSVSGLEGFARAAMQASQETGAELAGAAAATMTAALRSASEAGGELADAARRSAKGAVGAVGEMGGDAAAVAKAMMKAAADGAEDVSVDARRLFEAAAGGAVEAAATIGARGAEAVRRAVSEARAEKAQAPSEAEGAEEDD